MFGTCSKRGPATTEILLRARRRRARERIAAPRVRDVASQTLTATLPPRAQRHSYVRPGASYKAACPLPFRHGELAPHLPAELRFLSANSGNNDQFLRHLSWFHGATDGKMSTAHSHLMIEALTNSHRQSKNPEQWAANFGQFWESILLQLKKGHEAEMKLAQVRFQLQDLERASRAEEKRLYGVVDKLERRVEKLRISRAKVDNSAASFLHGYQVQITDHLDKGHTAYRIEVTGPYGTKWVVETRYSKLRSLYGELKQHNPHKIEFPPKKFFGNKEPQFVSQRRSGLQKYLDALFDTVKESRVNAIPPLARFFGIDPRRVKSEGGPGSKSRSRGGSKSKGRHRRSSSGSAGGRRSSHGHYRRKSIGGNFGRR